MRVAGKILGVHDMHVRSSGSYMNTITVRIPSTLLMVLVVALAAALPASAASEKKVTRVVERHDTNPKYDRAPSGEGVSRRESRLRRECKGRPNAGACAGYAN